jgi:MoaA/NifB/PqqE/SkfB family radical SAM enzyme
MIDQFERHRRLLFVPVTNGALLTPESAQRIARSGNVVPLVSIEGQPADTDDRRGADAHATVLRTFALLRQARACFGFAAMATTDNVGHLATEAFVDAMVAEGCAVGYFTEYVPCGPAARPQWVLDAPTRDAFRQRVVELRRSKPIVLIQFPHDEYGDDNRCTAAGGTSLHINAQGDVEPCPFAPMALESVRRGGLEAAFTSPFLRAIREHPRLLCRQDYACALFENRAELDALARDHGAQCSE